VGISPVQKQPMLLQRVPVQGEKRPGLTRVRVNSFASSDQPPPPRSSLAVASPIALLPPHPTHPPTGPKRPWIPWLPAPTRTPRRRSTRRTHACPRRTSPRRRRRSCRQPGRTPTWSPPRRPARPPRVSQFNQRPASCSLVSYCPAALLVACFGGGVR
jgi:hypothetical protein